MRVRSGMWLIAVSAILLWGVVSGANLMRAKDAFAFDEATPVPVAVSSRVYAQATPVAVENPALALAKVTIAPGGAIPTHHHPGTQIGAVVAGELTYTVETGMILVHRNDAAPGAAPESIEPGTTVSLGNGDTVIENPGSLHHARNLGTVPVEIWLSTLFPANAPRTEYAAAPVATP